MITISIRKLFEMRTIIDISGKQLETLTAISRRKGLSRAAAIRQAISDYLSANEPALVEAFGLWGKERSMALSTSGG